METTNAQIERQSAIFVIEKKINHLNGTINETVSAFSENSISLVLNAESLVKLNNEAAQIKTLAHFILVLQNKERNISFELKMLLDRILSQSTMNSSCLATNAKEHFEFKGVRAAYKYLSEILKTVK